MPDHEGEPAAWAQHAMNGGESRWQVGNVHQAKLAVDAVERLVLETREHLSVIQDVAERRRPAVAACEGEHLSRGIDADDLGCTRLRQCPRGESLTAGYVKKTEITYITD
jgi:hypothetical protein